MSIVDLNIVQNQLTKTNNDQVSMLQKAITREGCVNISKRPTLPMVDTQQDISYDMLVSSRRKIKEMGKTKAHSPTAMAWPLYNVDGAKIWTSTRSYQ